MVELRIVAPAVAGSIPSPPQLHLTIPDAFMTSLEERHLADLRFSEVTRALRALSSTYVERRESALADHKALDGAGKRAAFALYYGPIHFLLVQHIVRELGRHVRAGRGRRSGVRHRRGRRGRRHVGHPTATRVRRRHASVDAR